jgi:GT2 family glycosyltransferase
MSTPEDDRLRQEVARLRQRLDHAAGNITRLEQRLERIENSLLFRAARWAGSFAATRKRKLGQWLLHSPLHRLYVASRSVSTTSKTPAADWVEQLEATLPTFEWHVNEGRQWPWQPLISVVLPVSNPKREWLEAAVNSVLEQSYARWQLCVCDDGSEDASVARYFGALAESDNRVRFTRSDHRGGIAAALNAAGSLATGDFVAFLDHDDVLHRYALHYAAEVLQDRSVAVVYTDENDIDEDGRPVLTRFKPGWSPDLLLSCMYFGHLFVVARDIIEKAGWFRSCCDGAQDYDLALRITVEQVRVRHIPLPLYHWRRHAASTASSAAAKPYTHAAGRKALEDALCQRGAVATVEDGPLANTYFVRRKISGNPLVSIIICSRNPKLLAKCLRSLASHTGYSHRELIVIRHEGAPSPGFDSVLNRFGATGIRYTGAFNFARMNNAGVEAAHGDQLLFLNDDVQALQSDWLEYLVAHVQRPEIAAAGAKLVYPSGAIQHAGIATGIMEGAGHPGRGLFRSDEYPWLDLTRNVSAVTGACLGIRKSVFRELAGFDEVFPVNYNDVDLCLRARQAGYLIVLEPRAVLRHDECRSRTRGTRYEERERFYDRWGDVLNAPDPYYSPLFDRATEKIRIWDSSARGS